MYLSQESLAEVSIDKNSVYIETSSGTDIKGLEKFLKPTGSKISWFKHPYNQDSTVPHFEKSSNKTLQAHHTASRTIVTTLNGRKVAIKMPTDHPFGPSKEMQKNKVNMNADLKYSVARTKAIQHIDAELGPDNFLLIQKEIAAVIDKTTKNGFLIRDLSLLEDGNYYLPAHILPYVGKEIAQQNNISFSQFWEKHWAESLGRFQARLLIRHGMEVRAVIPQNFLIQLDPQMKPTGRLVWRDLAESHLIMDIAEAIGLEAFVDRDMLNGSWGVKSTVHVDSGNIHWRFNDVSQTLSVDEMVSWSQRHNVAYKAEIENLLQIKIPENTSVTQFINSQTQDSDSLLMRKIQDWHFKQRKKSAN